jgi:hypothetical protein
MNMMIDNSNNDWYFHQVSVYRYRALITQLEARSASTLERARLGTQTKPGDPGAPADRGCCAARKFSRV